MFVIIRAPSLLSGTRIDAGHKISSSNQNEPEFLDSIFFFKHKPQTAHEQFTSQKLARMAFQRIVLKNIATSNIQI